MIPAMPSSFMTFPFIHRSKSTRDFRFSATSDDPSSIRSCFLRSASPRRHRREGQSISSCTGRSAGRASPVCGSSDLADRLNLPIYSPTVPMAVGHEDVSKAGLPQSSVSSLRELAENRPSRVPCGAARCPRRLKCGHRCQHAPQTRHGTSTSRVARGKTREVTLVTIWSAEGGPRKARPSATSTRSATRRDRKRGAPRKQSKKGLTAFARQNGSRCGHV